jgi:hypothetical protein
MKTLEERIRELPPHLQREVEDFVEFVARRRLPCPKKRKPTFDWEGGLEDLKDQYTSVELQHEISVLVQREME